MVTSDYPGSYTMVTKEEKTGRVLTWRWLACPQRTKHCWRHQTCRPLQLSRLQQPFAAMPAQANIFTSSGATSEIPWQ